MIEYVIFASGGNDSIALVDYASAKKLQNVIVAYSNTGWASPTWAQRIERFKTWVESLDFKFVELPSEGFESLVRRKKGFPGNKPKFCTFELKIKPAQAWLEKVDPDKNAVCMVGVRREESLARKSWPKWVENSDNHGGRSLWSPLVDLNQSTRDKILQSIGWASLAHRSKECSPCVNSNRADFKHLAEAEMKRTMFRTARVMGASGIREVMKWAFSQHGKYEPPSSGCDSGMCGD